MTNSELERPFADIGERLKWHRALMEATEPGEFSQEKYALRANLKRSQLNNWESGLYRISIDGALALGDAYGLTLDFIYRGNSDSLPMTLRQAWLSKSRVA